MWAMSLELWCLEGKKNLWRPQCLFKVTTESSRTSFFKVSLASAIYARFQKLKSFWLFFLWFMARVCPAFCLGQEESCWQLFGLCDFFGDVCEEHVSMYTSFLRPQEAAPKNAAKLFLFSSLNIIEEAEVSSKAALVPSAMGSRALLLGLTLPGSCVLVKELHISLHELKPVTTAVRFLPYPRAWRPVPPLLPCQTSHLP